MAEAHREEAELMLELIELGLQHPVIQAYITEYQKGRYTKEEMLEKLVISLAKENIRHREDKKRLYLADIMAHTKVGISASSEN